MDGWGEKVLGLVVTGIERLSKRQNCKGARNENFYGYRLRRKGIMVKIA